MTHLSASGQMGGAESIILECVRAGDVAFEMTSLVSFSAGPLVTAAEALGATTTVIEPPAKFAVVGESFATSAAVLRTLMPRLWQLPTFVRRFSGAVAESAPQIIHAHGIKTHVLASLMPVRTPIVWHLHDYLGIRPVSSRLLPLLARRCALAIAVSESVAKDARRHLGGSVPVVVVYNAVDCDRFKPAGPVIDLDRLCALSPAPSGTVRIGLPATFARWKGHDVFLRALALLGTIGIRAYVIGAPVYQRDRSQWSLEELHAMVAAHGLQGTVGFTGFLSDMPAAYRALDVVVHASTRPEPFGLVIAEAMACGRALVAAPAGGAAELFVDGQHALSAASGDAEALAAILRRLAGDAALRGALGARARAHVASSFSHQQFAHRLRAALAQVPGFAAGGR